MSANICVLRHTLNADKERVKHMPEDTLLSVENVARRVRVHVDSVHRWIRAGELVAIDLGGAAGYRIAPAELERFIAERTTRRKDA
jgi:excisionase family DNA binding protein